MNDKAKTIWAALAKTFPGQTEFRRGTLETVADQLNLSHNCLKEFANASTRLSFGLYDLTTVLTGTYVPSQERARRLKPEAPVFTPIPVPAPAMTSSAVSPLTDDTAYVPVKDPTFVGWGAYEDIHKIVESRMFYPIYIAGLSGNGKTIMVEQACSTLDREYIRVQVSPETDEDDLIGGFRLLDGETVFSKGPVIKAMERGAILLIDELDRGTNKIMCLQGILEGKPVLVKKTGEIIRPSPGFNIIATANTKGKGSEDGRFAAAQIIDEAFLERFVCTIDQPYPNTAIEKKIVTKHMEKFGVNDPDFTNKLVVWSSVIRKSFQEDGVDEVISTRRLCHIAHTYSIFQDRMKAIKLCISRFDTDTREAFLDLYTKVDATANRPVENPSDQPNTSAAKDKGEPPPF
jgi:hypothetical protein